MVVTGFHYEHGLMEILFFRGYPPGLSFKGVGGLFTLFGLDRQGRLPYKLQKLAVRRTLLDRQTPITYMACDLGQHPAYSDTLSLIPLTQPSLRYTIPSLLL